MGINFLLTCSFYSGKGWPTFWTGWLITTLSPPACHSPTTTKVQTQLSRILTLDLYLLLQLPCHLPGILISHHSSWATKNIATIRLLPILTVVLEEEGGEPWLNHLQVRMGALFEKTTSHPGSLHSFGIFDISGESLTSAPGSQCV